MKRIDPSVGIEIIHSTPGNFDENRPANALAPGEDYSASCRMYQVDPGESKKRLDHYLSQKCLPFSRSRIQKIIEEGLITVNGHPAAASYKVRGRDLITVHIPPPVSSEDHAEDMDLDIIFEDNAILVLNKPPSLVVHPAPGHRSGTLLNGLLGHFQKEEWSDPSREPTRAGLVHRLDQDTSGLMVIGKSPEILDQLMGQFRERTVSKNYIALVNGWPPSKRGTIDAPIGRSSGDRKKFAVTSSGKPSTTKYRVISQYLEGYSLVDVTLLTGRTHQIRVHFQHLGFPLAGDPIYKRRGIREERSFPRIMLHAARLGFLHPVTGVELLFTSKIPKDMQDAIDNLKLRPLSSKDNL